MVVKRNGCITNPLTDISGTRATRPFDTILLHTILLALSVSLSDTPSVLIVIAMEDEAKPFIEHLGVEKQDSFFSSNLPFQAFSGKYEGCSVTVVTNGKDAVYGTGVDNVGTVPAAMVTYLALEKLPETDLVLNAGTCGGFQKKGAKIGSVFLTSAVANHDRRIQIPPFIPYGIGKVESPSTANLQKEFGWQTGVCTTGNSLDHTPEDDTNMDTNDASVKDMEGASIAWAAKLASKEYVGVKVVTDIVDGDRPTQDEFLENLGTAAKSLQDALPKVIGYDCGKKLSEL